MRFNQKCRKLCKIARASKDPADHTKYKRYRNIVNHIKNHEKRSFYREFFAKVGKNSQLLWNVVNNMLKKSNNRHGVPELLQGNKMLKSDVEICNAFNNHFASAGKKVQESITGTELRQSKPFISRVDKGMTFCHVTESEICRLVDKIKPKTSTGFDGISNWLLKKLISVIKHPLCCIFNKSLESGIYPNLMKLAKVVPLHKSGSKNIADNYRPISLLPVISKILERIVYNRTVVHLDANNIVFPRQFGFRKKHSTVDAVTNLAGEILKSFDENLMVLGVFIDLKKAFDTVSHSRILDKLSTLGIRGIQLEWFRSFLDNRRQFVEINSVQSKEMPMTVGVLQGALLSVLLFQIHINDLPKCTRFCSSILYADDTTLYLVGQSLKFLKVKMQHDLEQLSEWLRSNCLKLNVKKTKSVLFNKEGLTPDVHLLVDGEVIETVRHFRFLGITIDSSLSFNEHFSVLHDRL